MAKKIKFTEEEWKELNEAVPQKSDYPELEGTNALCNDIIRTKKSKDEIIVETMINKMFEIAGHNVTFEDIKGRTDNWYQQWTMTESQNKEWREWGTKYLKKQKHLVKYYAERQMAMFDLNYGLKLEQQLETNKTI
jgi:hypothetical protein